MSIIIVEEIGKIGWNAFEIEAQEYESACGLLKWIQNLVIIFSNKTSSSKRNHSLPAHWTKDIGLNQGRRSCLVRLKELPSTHDEKIKNRTFPLFHLFIFFTSSFFFLHNINFKFAEQIDWLLIQPENDASRCCHSN